MSRSIDTLSSDVPFDDGRNTFPRGQSIHRDSPPTGDPKDATLTNTDHFASEFTPNLPWRDAQNWKQSSEVKGPFPPSQPSYKDMTNDELAELLKAGEALKTRFERKDSIRASFNIVTSATKIQSFQSRSEITLRDISHLNWHEYLEDRFPDTTFLKDALHVLKAAIEHFSRKRDEELDEECQQISAEVFQDGQILTGEGLATLLKAGHNHLAQDLIEISSIGIHGGEMKLGPQQDPTYTSTPGVASAGSSTVIYNSSGYLQRGHVVRYRPRDAQFGRR
ncbi:hypothetical protein M231_00475 [Tremella mesenterica]|uniref:Uncharacterized protein n=1 Tax=Tremella mesenterica TaxID=5217 RepID=A0A4Q1BVI7_TREME|nr:hypothetical protein M231_00475 [Tremella mesenterica]